MINLTKSTDRRKFQLRTSDGKKVTEFEATLEEAKTEMEVTALKLEETMVLCEGDKELDSYTIWDE